MPVPPPGLSVRLRRFLPASWPVAVFLLAAGCGSRPAERAAQGDPNTHTAKAVASAPPAVEGVADAHALHNVHHLGPKMISGAVPEGDRAFDELRDMGVRTIISVDGASPNVAAAESRGMRYVHIPITYSEVSHDQMLEIARAVRDLPGPIFIHCHHGKHRSPAAVATVAVAMGETSPDSAVAWMKECGTASHYVGLYASAASAMVLTSAQIDAAPDGFPSVRKPSGMVAAMVEVDLAFEHLGDIRAAGWTTPRNHPDLVPAAEAGRLADQLRFSGEDPASRALGNDYMLLLAESIAYATALEEAIVRGETKDQLDTRFKLVQASCKECHAGYRDNRRR